MYNGNYPETIREALKNRGNWKEVNYFDNHVSLRMKRSVLRDAILCGDHLTTLSLPTPESIKEQISQTQLLSCTTISKV